MASGKLGVAAVVLALAYVTIPSISLGASVPSAMIVQTVDEADRAEIGGDVRPEIGAAQDLGAVADSTPLANLALLLRRPPDRDASLDQLVQAQVDPASPNYHHWLDPVELGQNYGLAASDIAALSNWLAAQGFEIGGLRRNGVFLDFSGTAGQVRAAFHTTLHRIVVDGETHVANFELPSIPAALAPAVVGIVKLNDFGPRSQASISAAPACESSHSCEWVTPANLAKIYDMEPAFRAGLLGKGQRVAAMEPTDVYSLDDWALFRQTYGLSKYISGSLRQIHPQPAQGKENCLDPGVVAGDAIEAILDAEWASAAAPEAAILLAACKDTNSQSGVLTATLNVLEMEASNRPQIITISYGECEPNLGPTVHAAFRAAFQIAALEGVSVYLAQGDYLSDACDGKAGQHYATHGLSVSGYATTGYNVSVGGTDFEDVYLGTTGSYWIDASSGAAAVAQSYIPEIPWNGSCANPLLARHLNYGGVNALCNTGQYVDLSGGGGGPSACALGHASISGEVSGTCRGEPRPTWQRGVVGLPENDVRMVPDISMFASEGTPWDHRLVFCNQGVCGPGGGTSFASPIMAGVQALVNQKMNATAGLGLVSPIYYALAKRELDGPNRSVMCAPLSILPGSTCVFHNVRTGGNAGPCASGTPKCFSEATGQHLGVLSRSTIEFEPAFAAHPGWNPATGLGSVDVTNLLIAWGTVAP